METNLISGPEDVSITIATPDDWHVHFRDGAMLRAVAGFTAAQFSRAIVMPNLLPPVTNVEAAISYRRRIRDALPAGVPFAPLMTCYLTDDVDSDELVRGHTEGVWMAAKLYPAHATTNSQLGVTDVDRIEPALSIMERIGMPLLVHGEVTDPKVDIFDREAAFIDRVLCQILDRHPALKVVIEHVTTQDAVDFVRANAPRLGATITPHHLVLNRNHLLAGGIRPHHYCLPIAKRERHRAALRAAATSGDACFFIGTDTAPHDVSVKESACGCAGVFNAPSAMQIYAQVFWEHNALDRLETFASLNGPRFYGLPVNKSTMCIEAKPSVAPELVTTEDGDTNIVVFRGDDTLQWSVQRADLPVEP